MNIFVIKFIFPCLVIVALIFASCKKEQLQKPFVNKLPVVFAHPAITVAAACGKAEINGYMKSYSKASVLWRQLAGPSPSTIVNPYELKTLLTNLTAGKYIYILEVTDKNGTGRDTTELTVTHTKENSVDNLTWENIDGGMVDVWAVTIQRPDLFCDTLLIKEILIKNSNQWHPAEPVWKGPGLSQYVNAMGGILGGHYYEHVPPDRLRIYVYGRIWSINTSAKIRFY